jgi:hypothetical protein
MMLIDVPETYEMMLKHTKKIRIAILQEDSIYTAQKVKIWLDNHKIEYFTKEDYLAQRVSDGLSTNGSLEVRMNKR